MEIVGLDLLVEQSMCISVSFALLLNHLFGKTLDDYLV